MAEIWQRYNNIPFTFVDYSLTFTRASIEECKQLKVLFDRYAQVLGHIFNLEKSSMFSSARVPEGQTVTIKTLVQLKVISKHEKHLGLPFTIGRKEMHLFDDVKLNVLNKISTYHNKLFSSGGKEVLIKVVAQAVPTFAMSVFKLPMDLCNDTQKVVAGFW